MIAARGTLALMTRSLRTDARSLRTYAVRLTLTGLTLFGLITAYEQAGRIGAPGLFLFQWIMWITLAMLTLAGLSYFATVISEEREEMTLGLLRMTRLNSISIILGKSGTRLVTTIVLLLAQIPFTLLAITLGGVSVAQVVAGYCMLAAYVVALGGIALLWSVLCRRSRDASSMTFMTLLCFYVGPWLGKHVLNIFVQQGHIARNGAVSKGAATFFDWLIAASPIQRLTEILGTGFAGPAVDFQVFTNLAAGLVCFALAWLLFEHLQRDELPTVGDASPKRLARRRRRDRRAWAAALLWKDFQYVGGGRTGLAIRAAVYGVVVSLIYVLSHWDRPGSVTDLGATMVWTAIAGLVIEASLLAAHVFRDEIRGRTLSAIMVLPASAARIAYAKIAGCLLSLIPAALLFCAGVLLTPDDVGRFINEIFDEPAAWLPVATAVFFVHLVAFLSLYLKWGALAAAVGILLIGSVVVQIVVSMFFFVFSGPYDDTIIVTMLLLMLIGLTAALHVGSGFRLRQLGGQ